MSKSWLKTPQEQLRDFGDLFDKSTHKVVTTDKGLRLEPPDFDGETYEPKFDGVRLRGEMKRVYIAMLGSKWWTLQEIHQWTGDPEASISARLRDLRKARFGAHTVNRRRRGNPKQGIWEYQLL